MNKTAIRNFAVWTRRKLIADVSYRAGLMGITEKGISEALPQSTDNMQFFDIGMAQPYSISGEKIKQRKSLVDVVNKKAEDSDYKTAYTSVIEEVAYTWFNRMIAIRFMEINDYLPSHIRVLSSESGKQEPDLVTTPFDADLFFGDGEQQDILQLKNDNKLDEAFRILFIKQCNALYPLLPRLFENLSDYTELLLNVSFIDQDGVVCHLIHDIPEEDFNVELGGQVEIIGWLYQYYNAELKDETFALLKQNVKVTKERVPSATQLFTPDWIVRYMVENSLGRLWVEGHPNNNLKANWKYYLEEAEQEADVKAQLDEIRKEYAKLNPEDIKVIDPCMGSGHILVYAFDVLMQIYESTGYNQRDAAKSIVENNIYGLDIDDRAAQLAYFAVMMKARQYNRRILTEGVKCNVMAIQESNSFDRNCLHRLGDLQNLGEKLVDKFIDAKEYGSILNIDITLEQLDVLNRRLNEIDEMSDYGSLFDQYESMVLVNDLAVFIAQARIMVQKYDAVITNPPYMGAGNMGNKLSSYLRINYSDSKSDMSTVCMEKTIDMCKQNGYMAMINIPVWMFISSYEKLRKKWLKNIRFENMVYPGRGLFGSDFGTVFFTVNAHNIKDFRGNYRKLFEKQSLVETVEEKEKKFFSDIGRYVFNQKDALRIPGNPIAFWVSKQMLESFEGETVKDFGFAGIGMRTGDNNRFLRLWFEVLKNSMGLDIKDASEQIKSGTKWIPYNKGGDYRKWYGNNSYVVNWYCNGSEIKENTRKVYPELGDNLGWKISNERYYFHNGITWTGVTMADFSCRLYPDGFIFDSGANGLFIDQLEKKLYVAAYLNTKVANDILHMINPTVNTGAGTVNSIPVIYNQEFSDQVTNIASSNYELSEKDWDSFETSWDFKKHPLI